MSLCFGKSLKTSSCRKSPTSSTLSLILDICHISLRNPVDIFNGNFLTVGGLNVLELFGNHESEIGLGKLLLGESRELVEALLVCLVVSGVVELDFGKVLEENLLPVSILVHRLVSDAVSDFPGIKF